MDYSTLKSTVLDRLSMSTDDPAAAAVGGYVNEALHEIETSTSDGWSWMRQTVDLTTTAGTGSYTFATIGALTTGALTVSKILDVKVYRSSGYYSPMDLIAPNEAELLYPSTTSAIPESWFTEASTLYIYPAPDAAYQLRIRVVTVEPDLTGSGSTPILPTVFHSAVVESACAIYYESLQDTAKMQATQQRVDRWVDRMKRYGPEYQRAPRVTTRGWDF